MKNSKLVNLVILILLFLLTSTFALDFKSDIRLIFWEVKAEKTYQQDAQLILNKIMEILANDFGIKVLDRTLLENILGEDALRGIVIEDLKKHQKLLGSEYSLDVQFFGASSDLTLKLVNIISGAVESSYSMKYRGSQDNSFLYSTLETIYKYLRQPIKNPSQNIKLTLIIEPKELSDGERLYIKTISSTPYTYLFVSDLDGNIDFLFEINKPSESISAEAYLPKGIDKLEEYVIAVALNRSSRIIKNNKTLDELEVFLKKEFKPSEWQIAFEKYTILRGEKK